MRHPWLAAGIMLAMLPAAPALAEPVAVEVAETGAGVYTVTGGFTVPAPDDCVWQVLTDYSRLGAFIPSMRSHLLERTGAHSALVAQDTTTTFLAVHQTSRVVLRIEETPRRRIDFTDVARRDFELYRGAWRLELDGAATRVAYMAVAKPRFVPPLMGQPLIKGTVEQLLADLRREMLRRAP